jgi:2-succinyl-6-hydroxy-2,4-cyclohexadiene-1-carboxylate synthase
MARLLLLHGFTGAPSSWQAVLNELPSDVQAFAPHLTGHGSPPAALSVQSFEAEVDRLASLLSKGSWQVAGYSLGARLALGLLARHRDRFERAVLISGRPGLENATERAARVVSDEQLARMLDEQGLAAFVEHWEGLPLFATQAGLDRAAREGERARRSSHEARGLSHSLRVTGLGHMPSYWAELSRITTPIDWVVGALDPAFCALGETVVGKLPNATLCRVDGAGHNLLLERPSEVAKVIARGSFK